jgi:hypothetical protein
MSRPKVVTLITVVLGLLASGCAGAGSATASSAAESVPFTVAGVETTQRSEGGEVTVEVDWGGPSTGAVFNVRLDTHTIDLDSLDLTDSVLANDRDETLTAVPWEAPKGGHHREGRLAFDGNAPAFLADARSIVLTIRGVGTVPERVLRWEIPS